MINCKTKNCIHTTMDRAGFEDDLCDTCWLAIHSANKLHTELMEMNDSEPLDGDEIVIITRVFFKELKKLNGTI